MLLANNSNLDLIIDELRRPREEDEPTIDEILHRHVDDLKIMLDYGWPYQDVMQDKDGEVSGIPIALARIVVSICDFCAKHNIDLSDAIGLTYSD